MNFKLLSLPMSFTLLIFFSLQGFAETKIEKSIELREKELIELKEKIQEVKNSEDYKGSLDVTEKNVDAFLSMIRTEKAIKESDESYKQLIKEGKLAVFEEFYKIVPENLKYKIPQIENNSYFDFCEFCEKNEWPAFNGEDYETLEKIEKFEKVSAKEVNFIRSKLKKQKAFYRQALAILKNRPFIYSPQKTIEMSIDLGKFRAMSKYLCYSSLLKFREGKKEEAISLVTEAHSLALLLEKRKGSFVELLVSNAMKGIARHRAVWILSQQGITEKQILSFQTLTKDDSSTKAWEDAVKYELYFSARMMFSLPFDETFKDEFDPNDFIEAKKELEKIPPEMTKEKEFILKFIKDTESFLQEKDHIKDFFKYYTYILSHFLNDLKHFPAKDAVKAKSYLTELIKVHDNLIWIQILTSLSVNNVLLAKVTYSKNKTKALKTIIAFRLYEIRRHSPPKNLQALVDAKLLKEIPLDAWSGKALKLNPQNRKISFDGDLKHISGEIEF